MADTRFMYGATEATAEALLARSPAVPKSVAQVAAPYIAELVGTFAIVFTTGCSLLAPGDPTWNATAVGFILMVMVYVAGPVSGGNLNPAVSFTLGLVGCLPWPVVIGYWVAQLVGGISAGLCFDALFTPKTVRLEPGPPFTWEYAATAEVIYTGLLCFVFLNCVVSRRNNPPDDANQFYGIAIGFSMIAGGYAVGGVSGACFNPAVALGLDISAARSSFKGWSFCWLAFELLGAAVAAAFFRILRSEEFGRRGDRDGLAGGEPGPFAKCLSEGLGSFLIVFTVCLNTAMGSPGLSWSYAAALLCLVYSLGDVSGGHFNPAITLAVALRGRCTTNLGIAYCVAQLVGAVLAGLVSSSFHAAGPLRGTTYSLSAGSGYGPAAAGAAELLFTLALAYVVLACTTVATPAMWKTRRNNFAAFAVAGSCAGGSLAASALSGGELNPAVCLGLVVSSLSYHAPGWPPTAPLANFVAFSFWELAGGALAALAFRRTHPSEWRSPPWLGK